MRLSLLSIVLALLLVMTAARRGTTSTPAPAAKKNRLVPQWGFPYGWGLGPGVEAEGMEVPELHKEVKQVKEVKRGTSMAGPIRNRIGILYCSHYLSIYFPSQSSRRRRARKLICPPRRPAGLDANINMWTESKRSLMDSSSTVLLPPSVSTRFSAPLHVSVRILDKCHR
jgi:hypothetical protein